MSSSGSTAQQPVQQVTQAKEPWAPMQHDLLSMYDQAGNMREGNVGYQPYTGQTVAGLTPDILSSIDIQRALANQQLSNPGSQSALDLANSIISNRGMTSNDQDIYRALGGLNGDAWTAANPYFQMSNAINLYGGMNEPINMYRQIAQEAQGQQNPYLQQILDAQNRMIGDRVNSSMSGAGRYGSGAHTDVMTRALAEAEAPLLQQDYEARQARRMAAAQGMLGGIGAEAGGMLAGYGAQGQGLQNYVNQRANLYNTMEGINNAALNRAGQWAQAIPGIEQAQYNPAQMLFGLGDYQRSLDQQNLDAQIKLYNAQQAYPWEQLAREAGILSGAGALGGTTVQNTSQPAPSTWQNVLGGGLVGGGLGSAFGPIGTGVGALGGGLLGLFR